MSSEPGLLDGQPTGPANRSEFGKHSLFLQYLKTGNGRFSLLLVIACGLALAFFVGLTFVDQLNHVYRLDFGKAQWVESATPSSTNYFRKTIYIEGPVTRGWLQISATDRYNLFVNGSRVDTNLFDSTCVTGLYDLRAKLQVGKNVIAVSVPRDSFPGPAQVLMRGFYSVVGAPLREFWSDPNDPLLRAAPIPDGIVNGYKWLNPLLDDTFWQLTKAAPNQGRFAEQAVTLDPRLLESAPTGKWITLPPGTAKQVSFAYNLQLPRNRKETWLEIASTGNYDLVINGRLITSETISTVAGNTARPGRQALTVKPVLQAYDVTRWMHGGTNSLLIRVNSQTLEPALLLADGYTVRADGKLLRFSTDVDWETFSFGQDKQQAMVIGKYGDQPWGYMAQHSGTINESPIFDLWKLLTWAAVVGVVLGGILALWVLSSVFARLVSRVSVETLWTCDALFLLCVLVLMLFLWLLTFDVRFDNDWCFKPRIVYGLAGLILAGRLLLLLPRKDLTQKETVVRNRPVRNAVLRYARFFALGCVVLLGFVLRFQNLTAQSLDTDEYSLIQFSKGIEQRGFPFIHLGSFKKDITTYEAVPYSIAVGRFFLGETEAAYRAHSLVFATITIALVGIAGARMLGWGQGLTAALIFATYPCALYYGVNAFWPSQQLLLAFTVFWCFFEAIRPGPIRPGFLTVATGCLIVAYLSWEGTGFVIPTLMLLMFAMRWGNLDWMKDWHLWRCFVVLGFAVGIQLTFRQVESQPPFLQTGISLSDVTTPLPVWLDLTRYSPDFYFRYCLFAENIFVMTLVTIGGIAFCWRHRSIRYLFLAIAALAFWYTEFLPAYAERYTFDLQTLLILASTGILFVLLHRITSMRVTKLRWVAAAGLLVTFILSTNGYVLQTYRLSEEPSQAFYAYRMGVYRRGYRQAAEYVAAHYRPGDGLLVAIPHVFEYYSKLKVDYSINTMLDKKITYSGALTVPHFLDKFRGYPCVRSLEELEDLRSRFKRLWIVQVPYELQQPEVTSYINQNAKVAFMTYGGEVDVLVATPDPNQIFVR